MNRRSSTSSVNLPKDPTNTMVKVLNGSNGAEAGYDFVTNEKLEYIEQKHMIVDDVAVVRRNRNGRAIIDEERSSDVDLDARFDGRGLPRSISNHGRTESLIEVEEDEEEDDAAGKYDRMRYRQCFSMRGEEARHFDAAARGSLKYENDGLGDDVSLCSMVSEPVAISSYRGEGASSSNYSGHRDRTRGWSISSSSGGGGASGKKRSRFFGLLTRKTSSFKFSSLFGGSGGNLRRMSEPVATTVCPSAMNPNNAPTPSSSSNNNNHQCVQRCVIITRDDAGYGLTVSGDNPVFVQSVKDDGAAARAGVRQGDRIIKVNGTLVTGSNHMDVVKMISSGSYVALTLLGRPPAGYPMGSQQRPISLGHQSSSERLIIGVHSNNNNEDGQRRISASTLPIVMQHQGPTSATIPSTSVSHHQLHFVGSPPSTSSTGSASSPSPGGGAGSSTSTASSSGGGGVRRSATTIGASTILSEAIGKEFITGPQPVDEEKQAEWRRKRILIIQQMLEEEKKHAEELRSDLKTTSSSNGEKTQQLYEQAQKRIRNLENQLSDFRVTTSTSTTATSTTMASATGQTGKQSDTIASSKQTTTTTGKIIQQSASSSIERSVESTDRGPPAIKPQLHYIEPAQIDVVPMEESDSDTETAAPLDTEGPFSNFAELKTRPAHLAVFLHYLISNSDPASLLFYLVSDFYSQGGGKDLRKWAYEIHSSFLVPTAPLRVSCTENDVWHDIENVLDSAAACEQEEVMKRLFVRARQKALDEINEHLADFRNKRTLGLGNVFGESMLQGLVYGDAGREKKIIDALLSQHFETFFTGVTDFDSLQDRTQVLAASLATILRHMGVKAASSLHEKLIEKCPSYAAKEKSRFGAKALLAKPSKKAVQIKGHHFLPAPVYSSTKCYQCAEMIWGLNAQAYFCSNCDVVVHKQCAGSLEDACYGGGNVSHRRSPGAAMNPYASTAAGKRLPKNTSAPQLARSATMTAANEGSESSSGSASPSVNIPPTNKNYHHHHHHQQQHHTAASRRHAIAEEPEDGSTSESANQNNQHQQHHQLSADDLDELCDHATDLPCSPPVGPGGVGIMTTGNEKWLSKVNWPSADSGYGGDYNLAAGLGGNNAAAASIIGRSQSMRSREEQVRMSRKNSTESNGRRTKSDVDADDKSIAMAQVVLGGGDSQTQVTATATVSTGASGTTDMSVSSSSSSVSRNSLPESPTASMDALRPQHQSQHQAHGLSPQPSIATMTSSSASASTPGGDSTATTSSSTVVLAGSDSDLEAETECPLLEDVLDWETIRHLKPKEKKRQEVINELFHTERTHVRNLKVLHRIFYERLLTFQILPPDFIKLLFANIEEVLDIHVKMNSAMKSMTKKTKLVGDIGDLMLDYLDGERGEQFRKAAATFCQHQQYALEALKLRQKKDQKLAQFLQEAEGSPVCRKLQLKDMIPMEMQRLTKYPLLIETVAKYTAEPSDEAEKLRKCIDCARAILDTVNTAKRNSENTRRLEDLHRRLDTTSFDKVQHAMVQDYRMLDLRQYKLVHDGMLTWRLGKNKSVDLHVVLLEDLLLLLTRNSDGQRLALRFHNITYAAGKEDTKYTHCPLLKLSSLMAKNVATDKKAFFLVSTSALGPQIYEMVAQSTSEKKTWFKFITEQIDACKRVESAIRGIPSTGALAPGGGGTPVKTPTPTQSQDDSESQTANANSQQPTTEQEKQQAMNQTARKLSEAGLALSSAAAGSTTGHIEDDLAPVERVQIVSQPRLINPSEVLVCQPTVLEHAEPVLTPLERLRRKDEAILRALVDKQQILAKLFDLPTEELDRMSESVMESSKSTNKEARELALAAIVQTNRLLEAINASMKLRQEEEKSGNVTDEKSTDESAAASTSTSLRLAVTEKPSVPCSKLTLIAAPLMKHLSSLLHSLQYMEDDLKRVRQELHQYKERTGESSENNSPASSVRKASSSKDQSESMKKSTANQQQPPSTTNQTTNIDEYLASGDAAKSSVPKLTVDQCPPPKDSRSPSPKKSTGDERATSTPIMSRSATLTSNSDRASSTPASSSASDRQPSRSPSRTSEGSSTKTTATSGEMSKSATPVATTRTEPPPVTLPLRSESPRKEASTTPNQMKSPESSGEGNGLDDEKRRERRRQKRQRHTALSGLESSPSKQAADGNNGRNMSLDEEDSPDGILEEKRD